MADLNLSDQNLTHQNLADDAVLVEDKGPVTWVRLNRPEDENAFTPELFADFVAAIEKIERDDRARIVVITGSGSSFCFGGDLKTFRQRVTAGEHHLLIAGLRRMKGVLRRIETSRRPYIAAVNGLAMAGGFELVLCCDLVFAAESAKLGDGHLKFGVVPGSGSSVRLPRKLPRNIANRLLMTGELVSARQMMQWGLVNEVVPDDELEDFTTEFADRIANLSPIGLAWMKQVVPECLAQPIDVALRNEIAAFEAYCHTSDFLEGLAAFAEKREPKFTGR